MRHGALASFGFAFRCAPRFAFGFALSILLAGCQSFSPSESFEAPLRGEQLPEDDERVRRVLRDYLETSTARSALRGSARVTLEGPDFKLNRPQRILVERDDRLRFEVIGLFDQIAAMLAVDGEFFSFFDAATGKVTRGSVTPSLLWDLVKIDLEIREIVEILLAAPRPTLGLARSTAWLEPEGRLALVFVWPRQGLSQRCHAMSETRRGAALWSTDCLVSQDVTGQGGEIFYFDPAGRLVEMRSLEAGGRLRYAVTFERYERLGGDDQTLAFPKRVTIRSPAAGSTARFAWKRVMLADELSDRFFEIRPRATERRGP